MTPLAAAQIAAYRAAGWEITITPTDNPLNAASSWIDGDTKHIEMFLPQDDPLWLFVFLHEVAHHVLGHTLFNSTEEEWAQEWAAECWALQVISALTPDDLPTCVEDVKRHMRGVMQSRIADDWGAERLPWDIIAWAGCDVPDPLRHMMPKASVTPAGVMQVELTTLMR